MKERKILEKSIEEHQAAIDKAQKELAELDKPKLRHGDYGINKNGVGFVVTAQSNNPKVFFEDGSGQMDVNGRNNDAPNKYGYFVLGNIFDDLKRNSEDLEEIRISLNDKNVRMDISRDGSVWIHC